MSNQQEPENLAFDNEGSLQTLVRAITFSQGQFSLIILRCNYVALRQRMVERLHQVSPVEICEITLPASVKTLYTNIREQLGDEQPPALMIFGLESVKDIDTVLTSANQVREEFRKNFPFPILLWVNDSVLQKFIRLATDLENWATIIEFENPTDELVNFLQQKTDEIFAGNITPNPQMCRELETARQDLQNRGEVLEAALQASLEFLLGLNDYLHDQIDSALSHYQQSLGFWRQSNYLERKGILLVNIASAYNRQSEKIPTENQRYWQESRNYFQQAIEIFEQAQRSDLVAKHITKLGEVLRDLQAWPELQILVEKSLPLHQNYGTPLQLAKDYGFLAEVALEQSRWDEANQFAGQALEILAEIPNLQSNEFGLYWFILAKSQQGLGQVQAAITNLEAAKIESHHQYNPQLYISILERLCLLYFKQGEYLKAFHIKQEQLQIEQQYGFRAFVGASYLNPQRQAINSAQFQAENPETIAEEIATSGRGQDVKRLRERIGGTEHKLTVIHGQSGVGKSSILQGGLIPALQQQAIGERDALPILLRVYTDWVGMLGQCLAKAFEEIRGNKLFANLDSSAAILEQLRRNADRNLLTVLIFDQFEEFFFVYPDQVQRRAFYEFLRVCLDIPFVKIILSLREDYLHYLLELDRLFNLTAINNNILDKNIRYYLGNFSPADAKAVVQSLTERSQFYLEPALIDELVLDLAGELGEVRPIELQIVGTQLQTEKITTLEKYRQFGTKEKLVERFLEEVIQDCGAENEQVARLVLYLLTDENGTRPLKTRAELAADLVAEVEKLDLVLEIFVASRLVLLLPESPADRYQLVHDYLVSLIRQQQGDKLITELEKERTRRKLSEDRLIRVVNANEILTTAQQQAKREPLEQKINIRWVILMSLIKAISIAGFVSIVRLYGLLQPLELRVYDQMLRSRPAEAPDRRIVLVKITDEDLKREKWPLSDRIINQLLKKIESYQPRIVGLYLFRPEDNNLAANLQNQDNIVTTCLFSSLDRDEIPPPPNVPIDNVGFSDVVADHENDQILRRTLLFANSTDKKCTTSFAFGALIAINYLEKQGIAYDFTKKGDFILGKTLFPRLQTNSGGYQNLDAGGYQILLNYHHPNSLADQVNLTDVLSDRVNPNLFKDRLVIIGTTAANIPPSGFYTPYSALPDQPARMPALFIHAQMASQLISTVLDGRPLIKTWSESMESLWIFGWSVVGASISLMLWRLRSLQLPALIIFIAMTCLAGGCYMAFILGWWLPLIPAIVTLLCSIIPTPLVPSYPLDKLRFQRTLELILEAYNENLADARIAVEYLIYSNPSKRTTTEGLVSVAIDALNSCQTLESIAAFANQIAWMPSQLPKPFSSLLLVFLRISQGVKTALDETSVYHQRQLLEQSVTTLRFLSANLASENLSSNSATFRNIAERWLAILNDRVRK
ncbi:MAG: CHASE2 domain-containing protein [Nostoc sp. DedQUE12b]|uniref:CHASE2 domain-containing protein n=1 Tax=Nostoc sp. DedQUE12b TaxID=3075398 RepID=UPI002AD2F3E9|nr:CHASE2 domain-containing protein [Nostoc sp. DedQUE12b]MDZ8088470.1 CHASE2 domain-containing protein [Nostoc sp. DedQUE12b]